MAENGSYSSLRSLPVEIKDKPDLFAVIIRAFAELLPFTGQINPLTEEAADTLVVEISGGACTYVVGSAGFKIVKVSHIHNVPWQRFLSTRKPVDSYHAVVSG